MDIRFAGVPGIGVIPPAAVVIDVMRAFTVAAWAFALGAKQVVLAESVDEALALKARHVVAEATARVLRARQPREVTFVITGDDGRAEEDLACAHYIAQRTAGARVEPAEFVLRAARSAAAAELAAGLRRGYRGIHPQDVALCLEADRFPFAMVGGMESGQLSLRPCPAPLTAGTDQAPGAGEAARTG